MYRFRFEELDCFQLALEVADTIDRVNPRRGQANIYDQTLRAAQSVVMNIAEGASSDGKAAINHFRIAQGSAGETLAGLYMLRDVNAPANQDKLRRVSAMLTGLIKTWR